jgi:hypothetical protein
MHVSNITMHIDHSFLSDSVPQTTEEKIRYAKDALSEINNQLRRQGISVTAFIEADDIRIES